MENLGWGLQMTVLGMGIVFALLAVLWGLLVVVLRMDDPLAAGAVAPQAESGAAEPRTDADAVGTAAASLPTMPKVQGMDADLVAAIMVAVLTHEIVRRQEAAPEMRSYWPGSLLYASRWVASGRSRQNHSWQRRGR
jgi:Na+-transporting methylmalonyl-CoA/oxaloacetate decarboxylase gamma subunit